ncbi:MAG: SAM-dependent methyltransferase [Candidatus Moduliflexus flocculans]|nr:SAM-dependent methyltransferase [Candidatus Moduliflexus flocculans]
MRKDVGVDGDAQRISQLVWMFFLKIFDDREEELELLRRQLQIPAARAPALARLGHRRRRHHRRRTGRFRQQQPVPHAQRQARHPVAERRRARWSSATIFEDAYNYMKSGTLMRQVINKINEHRLQRLRATATLFGDIYETDPQRPAKRRQRRRVLHAPRRHRSSLSSRSIPQLGETVLDPACGTGGFLACAIEHMRKQVRQDSEATNAILQDCHSRRREKAPAAHAVHDQHDPARHRRTRPTSATTTRWPARCATTANKDRVDVIVTNPPFGGMEEDGIENNFPADVPHPRDRRPVPGADHASAQRPAAAPRWFCPTASLFGEGVKTRIKEKLLDECNLHTIVRLPNGVFNPYTGIKTNLLFFTKGQPTKHVWYYEHPYPPGVKSYNKTKPIRFEEFQPEIDWWGKIESDGFKTRVET